METVTAHPEAKVVSVVHAETSTGAEFPLDQLAAALKAAGSEALLYADCVTSLGGQPVEAEAWGLDYGYSCSQKALGCPPGLAPVTISDRAIAAMQRHQGPTPYYYDFEELAKYWIDRPITYHHTMPILQFYALYTGVRLALEEGLEARWARNEDAGRYFQDEIRARGFELLADPDHQLVELTAVKVPEGIDGKEVQTRFLRDFNLEVGGGLGPKAPPIWRVGLMGVNAHPRGRRSGPRRVRRRAAAVAGPWPPRTGCIAASSPCPGRTSGRWRRLRPSGPTSCSSTSKTPSRPARPPRDDGVRGSRLRRERARPHHAHRGANPDYAVLAHPEPQTGARQIHWGDHWHFVSAASTSIRRSSCCGGAA